MCLNRHEDLTAAMEQGEWPVKAYKVLRWDFCGRLLSPFQAEIWKPGVFKSDRSSKETDRLDSGDEINRGIHVFLIEEDAEESLDEDQVVAEVICQKEHFVAAGSDNGGSARSAVFTEVLLAQEEYDRVLAVAQKLPLPNRRTTTKMKRNGKTTI